MRPGSRTLEAPRGNPYAPARGMRLMMMSVNWCLAELGTKLREISAALVWALWPGPHLHCTSMGKPSQYVTSHPGQLSLAILSSMVMRSEY